MVLDHPGLPETALFLALKVQYPLSPRQTEIAGYPTWCQAQISTMYWNIPTFIPLAVGINQNNPQILTHAIQSNY